MDALNTLQAQIDALEAKRTQAKQAVDLECLSIQNRLQELEKEANALIEQRNQAVYTFTVADAKDEGKLELLRQMLEESTYVNNSAE